MALTAIQIELLNAPRLTFARRDPYVLERKDAAMLAVLAIDGPAPRARIASLLWPESPAEAARNSLRQRLFRLRKAAASELVIADNSLRLAESAVHDLAQLAPRIEADADALRGELLGNHTYDDCEELNEWVQAAREQWRIARRNAVAERAARLEADGRLASSLRYAERLVADEPLLEHGHRRLMRLHYLRGDRAAAMLAFERCSDLLRRELRTRPSQETLELAALIERSGSVPATLATTPKPVALLRPPRLIGRQTEWRQIERAHAERRTVLLSGEAGIGKSRLLAEFAAVHGNGPLFSARPGDASVPYALLARMLRGLAERFGAPAAQWVRRELARVAADLGPPTAERHEAVRLQQAVAEAFAQWRAAGHLLLVLDDLHFADQATLELLTPLIGEAWLPAVLSSRGGELPPTLRRWLAEPDSSDIVHLELGPLDASAIEALLESLSIRGLNAAQWAVPLARHTGGSPLFILETLLALLSDDNRLLLQPGQRLPAPASVNELIDRRLHQLSAAALRLARVAAIAGQDFSAALAAAVLRTLPLDLSDSWHELQQAQIFRAGGFAHDLFCEVALRSLPQPIAQLMHAEVAAFLQSSGAAPARVAQHHLQAQQWPEAGKQFRAAARAAAAVGRKDEEIDLLERAADCFSRAGDATGAVHAYTDLANVHLTFSRFPAAWAAVQQARDHARTDEQRLWCLDAAADIHNNAREHEQALRCADQALALARQIGDARSEFNAARKAAGALATLGRYDEALQLHEAQQAWAANNEDDADVRVYLCDRGYLLEQAGRSLEAIGAYRRAIEIARRSGDGAVDNFALTNLAVTHWRLGQYEAALAAADQASSLRTRLGGGVDEGLVDLAQRAAILRDLGRFAEALATLEPLLPELRRQGSAFWTTAAEDHLALLYLQLGQPGRTGGLLRQPAQASAAASAHRLTVRACVERIGGGSGRMLARQAVDLVETIGPVRLHLLAQVEYACAIQPQEGANLCIALAELARLRQSPGLQAHALLRAGALFLRAGRSGQAAASVGAAQRDCAGHLPFGLYTAEKDWIAYQVLAAAGDHAAAREALASGVHWILEVALPHVPAVFRDSFLQRNAVNRLVLDAARRLNAGRPPRVTLQ